MIIPVSEIEAETLQSIAESFVLREGTDYGEVEASFADKVEQVLAQLKAGDIVLVYSELHETIDIKPKEALLADDGH